MTAYASKGCLGVDLVAAYEEMRKGIVEHLPECMSVSGMGIVLSRGLAAWIDASQLASPSPTTDERIFPKQGARGRIPRKLESEIVAILTNMSMSVIEEGAR